MNERLTMVGWSNGEAGEIKRKGYHLDSLFNVFKLDLPQPQPDFFFTEGAGLAAITFAADSFFVLVNILFM